MPKKGTGKPFEALVEPEPMSGCHIWIGHRDRNGYGLFRSDGEVLAHRVSYRRERGDIPQGLELDHLCRFPPCVNARHLRPVTHRENMLCGTNPPAVNARKTTCPHGHVLVHAYSQRICRECRRLNGRRASERYRRRRGQAARAGVCPKGHMLTYSDVSKRNICAPCNVEATRRWRERRHQSR